MKQDDELVYSMDLVKARTRQAKLEVALQILQDEIWKQEEKVTNNQRALYRVRTTRPKRHPGHHPRHDFPMNHSYTGSATGIQGIIGNKMTCFGGQEYCHRAKMT